MALFLKGLILGFSIAAPVGPIGLLCIRRTLTQGRASGFVSGLGAATADAAYGFIAAFGLTAVSSLLLHYKTPISVCGGLFLLYLSITIFLSKPLEDAANAKSQASLCGSYLSTAFLTLTNPATILSFIAVFAGMGVVAGAGNYGQAAALVMGVFFGSAFWWFLLSNGIGFFQTSLSSRGLKWINRVSGLLIGGLGLVSLIAALR